MVAEIAGRGMTRIPKHRPKQQLQAETRRKEVIRMTADNVPLTEQAKTLGVAYITVRRDRKLLMEQTRNETATEMQLYRDDQLNRIADKWEEIETDETMSGAEKHLAWSRWMKLEMDLRGTAAPTKSISAHVDVNPEHSADYLLFREACAGLTEDQLHQVYTLAKALPRTWVAPPIEANFPPPMTKALPEVNE